MWLGDNTPNRVKKINKKTIDKLKNKCYNKYVIKIKNQKTKNKK